MRHITINRHPGTHNVAAIFWLLAGVIVLIASGDAFALLTAAAVIVTAVWWMVREIEHRVRNRHAEFARVIHLRRASTSQRHPKNTAAHAPWRGRGAA
jgi:uncharacterized membrane protein YhiD involved in acid resistance